MKRRMFVLSRHVPWLHLGGVFEASSRLPATCPRLTTELRGRARAEASAQVVVSLSALQHGVVARRQLLAAGVHPRWIDRRVHSGRLALVHRGAYAVGDRRLTGDGRFMAAVLACGPDAVVASRSAGELLNVRDGGGAALDVLVRAHRRGPGTVSLRVSRDLLPEDVVKVRGIPCTTLARTLLDLAALLPEAELRQMIASARRLGILDEDALRRQVARHRGHPGARVLTRLVAGLANRTESELEDAFLALVRRARRPVPEVNHRFEASGRRVRTDFRWPAARAVVEVDGWATHQGRAAFVDDADRALDLHLDGWRVVRLVHHQVHGEPGRVLDALDLLITPAFPPAGDRPRRAAAFPPAGDRPR